MALAWHSLALVGQPLHVVEKVEHQQGLFQTLGGDGADFRIGKQVDQRLDVEAAEHGGQQFGGELARNEGVLLMAAGHGVEESRP